MPGIELVSHQGTHDRSVFKHRKLFVKPDLNTEDVDDIFLFYFYFLICALH